MTTENIENHMAYTCKCGGVNFALLKSGGIECNKCSSQLDGVKWWAGGMGAQLARAIKAEDQRDALQAKLSAMGNTEPVAWMDEYGNPFTLSAHKGKWYGHGERNWKPLYTAPKVAPEQVEAAWRAGWAACRDAEYVGQEAEDETWGMSETCANADWESAAPKVAQPLSTERFKAITNSLSRQQGWDGDGWDLALKEAIEAAHEIGGQQP